MGEASKAYIILVEQSLRKWWLERPRCKQRIFQWIL